MTIFNFVGWFWRTFEYYCQIGVLTYSSVKIAGVTVFNFKTCWVFSVKTLGICFVQCAKGCFERFFNIIGGLRL